MSTSNYSWKHNSDSYFPGEGGIGGFYADSNAVFSPQGKIVVGASFYAKGNRVAPRLICVDPDFSNPQLVWNGDNNGNYWPGGGGIGGYYADSNHVICPEGKFVKGIMIYPKGNRIALKLYCGESIHNDEGVWIENQDFNSNYWPGEGGVSGYYCDSTLLIGLGSLKGVAIVPVGNRMAMSIFVPTE